MNYKNYYDTLGVAKDAPEKDVKSAYRKLARKWHPDANPDNPSGAEERFKEIQEAYEVLGDAEKRRKYDALGNSDWQRAAQQAAQHRRTRGQSQGAGGVPPGGFPGGFPGGAQGADFGAGSGFSDFFEAFFSGMGRRPGEAPGARTAQDLETPLELSLTEAHEGGQKSVSLQIEEVCSRCRGSGIERGRICPTCHGTGRVLATKHFDVSIPKGIRAGQRIRLAGQGGAGANGQRGDLYLNVTINVDNRFTRKGDDIYIDVQIGIYDLVLGGEIRVPTMSGEVTVTVPPGSQNQRVLRLPGKGMPSVKGTGTGDQYVRLIGMLPQQLTDREYKLFRELASLRGAGGARG